MNLESITVVIPAHNRPEKLRRVLHYYSQTNMQILVSDSSDILFLYLYEFTELIYFHYPKEQFLRKINKIYFNFFSLIQGKNRTLPIFYGAREKDYSSAAYSTVPSSVIRSSPKYIEEFQNFFHIIVNELTNKQNVDIKTAKNLLSELLQDPKKDYIHPLKRKLLNLLNVYGPSELVKKYLMHTYKVKAIKITKGMKSYPYTFSTPETDNIVHYISTYK